MKREMKLGNDWAERSALSLYEAAVMLAVRDDPRELARSFEHDQKHEQYFYDRVDVQQLIAEKIEVLVLAAYAHDLIELVHTVLRPDGSPNASISQISTSGFLAWCKRHHYDDIVEAFAAIARTPAATSSATVPVPLPATSAPPPGTALNSPSVPPYPWVPAARQIGVELARKHPHFSREQIAKKVHAEMTRLHEAGHPEVLGRSKRVPSAGTIKRHALNGT